MSAKELIEAATYCEQVFGQVEDMSNDAGAVMPLVRHILATVRPDDDEPVTELACMESIGTPRINDWGDAVWMFGVHGPSLSIGCMCGTVTLTWGRHPIDLPDDLTMGRLRDILRGFGLKTNG